MNKQNVKYQSIFHSEPNVMAQAPARANLIGEHTDYNNGYVLPFPLQVHTTIEIGFNKNLPSNQIQLSSSLYKDKINIRNLDEKPQNLWTDYIIGSLKTFAKHTKVTLKPMNIFVDSNIPIGAGISSSAALEIATIRAMCKLYDIDLKPEDIAILGQKAENEYIGMPCGIMDQFTSSVGKNGNALFLDCSNLSYKHVKLPDNCEFVIVPSGIQHKLIDGAYAKLVKQCKQACQMLNVNSLRDLNIDDLEKLSILPEIIKKRAHHVITENHRVLQTYTALKNNDIISVGNLLYQSHTSQKNDYEITIPETDNMVKDAIKFGAIGARQTGGGFGGSLIIILQKNTKIEWWQKMKNIYPKASII